MKKPVLQPTDFQRQCKIFCGNTESTSIPDFTEYFSRANHILDEFNKMKINYKDIINDNYLNWLNDDEITSYLEICGEKQKI